MNGAMAAANVRPAHCAQRAGGNIQAALAREFRAKWTPVRAKKMRQEKRPEPGSDSVRTDKTLARKIFRLELDRQTMRRPVGGVIPGIAISMQGFGGGDALCSDQTFQRAEPMAVIGFTRIGIAC